MYFKLFNREFHLNTTAWRGPKHGPLLEHRNHGPKLGHEFFVGPLVLMMSRV